VGTVAAAFQFHRDREHVPCPDALQGDPWAAAGGPHEQEMGAPGSPHDLLLAVPAEHDRLFQQQQAAGAEAVSPPPAPAAAAAAAAFPSSTPCLGLGCTR